MLADADCGFCMRTARQVPRLGVDVDVATIQQADLVALGVDPARALTEMPYVGPDGEVVYGHRAWAAVLRTGPLPWRVVGRLMTSGPLDPLSTRVYHWVASNRERLPGGTPSCSIDGR